MDLKKVTPVKPTIGHDIGSQHRKGAARTRWVQAEKSVDLYQGCGCWQGLFMPGMKSFTEVKSMLAKMEYMVCRTAKYFHIRRRDVPFLLLRKCYLSGKKLNYRPLYNLQKTFSPKKSIVGIFEFGSVSYANQYRFTNTKYVNTISWGHPLKSPMPHYYLRGQINCIYRKGELFHGIVISIPS